MNIDQLKAKFPNSSEAFLKANSAFLETQAHLWGQPDKTPLGPKKQAKRLRQDTKPLMNKLETRFYEEMLLDRFGKDDVKIQAIRLELALSIWYKPDFFIPAIHDGNALAFEVKGPKAFRGGFENLKVAARVHQWINFRLVWWADGEWHEQQILP